MSQEAKITIDDIGEFDFVEFGASRGRPIAFAMDYLGGTRGLGVDINSKKFRRCVELDSDEYLKSLGFKYFYSDWKGHSCHLPSTALCRILKKMDWKTSI